MPDRPASPLNLMDWTPPTARQRYFRRDTAFYALSIGGGHAPLDQASHALLDPWHPALQALPSMALVLGYPGFWLGTREVEALAGIRVSNVLHVEQSVTLHRPLPVEGDVEGTTRVTGLVDKGAERGSLLYSERTLRLHGEDSPLATCRQVHYLRGAGGMGNAGQATPPVPPPPAGPCDAALDIQTRPEQALLYRLNGDANTLHIDPETARGAGFERPILHGMCTVGIAVYSVLATLAAGRPSRMAGFAARMMAPVLPGDRLRTEVWASGAFRTRVPDRGVVVAEGTTELP